ncbi:hypothetical protein [Petroclostridium sp. X23]|uniref:hypothetical protein n=1 Tax=Petroclostridium sp. X23 TaxID=3045146 RepID=UPI0024AD839C|nr:hypothetical protein [Petroclostridium sp. X23]WHH59732.1 hypothetical protein QKW49_02950 [Petroclostridium sp. X23]
MEIPVSSSSFQNFIVDSQLFEKTNKALINYLINWYNDNPEAFIDDMRADLNRILQTYNFHNERVAISKSYSYEPPLDYIACDIRITDEEDSCCCVYTAFFDQELNIFDDKICG